MVIGVDGNERTSVEYGADFGDHGAKFFQVECFPGERMSQGLLEESDHALIDSTFPG